VLIGPEGAHAFCVGIFGGDEHLRHFRAVGRATTLAEEGGRIQKGAQERTTTIQSIQSLMEKWDNQSSHMIIMLSGGGVPLLSDLHRRTLASRSSLCGVLPLLRHPPSGT
jgi:hypothetical protein